MLAAAAAAGYLHFNPERRAELLEGTPLADEGAVTTVYKWRDGAGRWQISDRPPPGDVVYDRVEYRRDLNVLPLPPRLESSAQ